MSLRTFTAVIFILTLAVTSISGQMMIQPVPDPNFDAKIANPAYVEKHPKVLFDEAHFNDGLSSGRYKGLFDLMKNDGYQMSVNKERFTSQALAGYTVLIIVNAVGSKEFVDRYDAPAFTGEECDAIQNWVNSGGSLFLIAGATPFGKAAENLAKRFGVEMGNGRTVDKTNKPADAFRLSINFARENNLLSDHPILQGRSPAERINRILAYSGQSLKGSTAATISTLLRFSATAVEKPGATAAEVKAAMAKADEEKKTRTVGGNTIRSFSLPDKEDVSVAGRAQAMALGSGSGRVVILGESDMLSTQLIMGQVARLQGKESLPLGMSAPGNDNRQFALNIMHWLSGLLAPNDTSQKTNVNASAVDTKSASQNTKSIDMSIAENKKLIAPTFTGTALDGEQFDLAALRGKVVVLNFWFLGCPPCIAEMPDLNKLVADYKDEDVVFLSVALEDETVLRKFLKNREFKYHLIPNGVDIIMGKYAASIYPTHIVVDKEGRMDLELVGKNSFKKLREGIEKALASK